MPDTRGLITRPGPARESLKIHLLGLFRISVDGEPVEDRRWTRRAPKTLIKLLALEPHHRLHREQVMEALWPDQDSDSAGNNLNKTIHAGRRALEPLLEAGGSSRFIITQGQQVMLSAPEELWVDAEAFEQLGVQAIRTLAPQVFEDALALYKGDLLPEDLYEDWASARREQLKSLYRDLLGKHAELNEARGLHQESIGQLKQLLACDETNEAAHRSLMRLYALTGNRSHALHQFRLCAEALKKGLDTRPDSLTLELRNTIECGGIQAVSGLGQILSHWTR